MNIIAGFARNIILEVPPTMEVRPTAVRSRKGLFDSLCGCFDGAAVLDLFSGSGALGLEAASRGAAKVVLVENNVRQLRAIEANIAKVRKTGAPAEMTVIRGDASNPAVYASCAAGADVIFADPPYAQSAEIFRKLTAEEMFLRSFSGALLVWELPDHPGASGEFMNAPAFSQYALRKFGSTVFLIGTIK